MNLVVLKHRPKNHQRFAGITMSTRVRFLFVAVFFLFSFFVSRVNAQSASISASSPNGCEDGTPPVITFDASSPNGGPYTFIYERNGVSQTDIVDDNPPATRNVPVGS